MEGHIGSDGLWVRELLEEGGVQVDRVEVVNDEVSRAGWNVRPPAAHEAHPVGHRPSGDPVVCGRRE